MPTSTAARRPLSVQDFLRDLFRDLKDFVALMKPRITAMVVATSYGGFKLAAHHAPLGADGSLPEGSNDTLAMLLVG